MDTHGGLILLHLRKKESGEKTREWEAPTEGTGQARPTARGGENFGEADSQG